MSGEKSEVDLTGSRDTFCHPEGVTRQEDRNVSAVVFQVPTGWTRFRRPVLITAGIIVEIAGNIGALCPLS